MELISKEGMSETELLDAIKQRVAYMLEFETELLMSYLYRLDILEYKIQNVLSNTGKVSVVDGLSQLILKRQIERIASKKKYKQTPIEGWEW